MPQAPEKRTIDLAGGSIHALVAGSGQDLVLLHHDVGPMGWPALHEILSGQFRVWAMDLPGWGESPRLEWLRHPRDIAAVILATMRQAGLRNTVLVGPGFGGWVAAEMAVMAHPEIAALVLIGSAGLRPDEGFILDQVLEEHVAYLRAGFSSEEAFLAQFPDPADRDLRRRLDGAREMVARVSWKPYMYSYELAELLPEVPIPAAIIWGAEDRVIPLDCASRFATLLPAATSHTLAGRGHFADLEAPAEVAVIIAATAARARKE